MNAYSFMRHGRVLPAIGLACLVTQTALAETVSGSSGPTFVDSTSPSARFCKGTATLAYSPQYASATAADTAYVILRKVDSQTATATELVQCEPGSGDYDFTPETGNDHRLRLSLTAYDSANKQIGSVLTADLVTPFASGMGSAGVKIDTRTNSLQEVADAGGTAPLAFSTDWATNGTPASVRITCVRDCRMKTGQLLSSETNTVFTAAAPATGDHQYQISLNKGGDFTLRYTLLDAQGDPLGDDLTAFYSLPLKFGMMMFVR